MLLKNSFQMIFIAFERSFHKCDTDLVQCMFAYLDEKKIIQTKKIKIIRKY